MNNQLDIILAENSVVGDAKKQLMEAFGAPFIEAGEILETYKEIEVTDESQVKEMKLAREKRLTLRKIRTGVETRRKKLKEESLRTGRTIDAVARYVKETIQPAEEYLELQEKFLEIREAEKKAKLRAERVEELSKFDVDVSLYNIDAMNSDQFAALIKDLEEKAEKARVEAIEAEKQRLAEEEAERKRQEEIVAENARLKAEAEKREAEIQAERERIAAENEAREKVEAQRRAEEQKRLEAEQAARAAEERRLMEEAEAERAALAAPDKEKLIHFAECLTMVMEKIPAVKTEEALAIANLSRDTLEKLQTVIKNKASKL